MVFSIYGVLSFSQQQKKGSILTLNLNNMQYELAQATIDVLGIFILPFIVCLVISWVVSLFRFK